MSRRSAPRKDNRSAMISVVTVVAAIGFVALATLLAVQMAAPDGSGSATIGPKLSVDQEKIDLGRVVYDKTVRAEFTLMNVGDQALQITDRQIPARLLQGC